MGEALALVRGSAVGGEAKEQHCVGAGHSTPQAGCGEGWAQAACQAGEVRGAVGRGAWLQMGAAVGCTSTQACTHQCTMPHQDAASPDNDCNNW